MDEQMQRQVNLLHANICQAMADPTRILIIYALAEGAKHVHELAASLDMPQPTVSRHLKTLRERRIVNAEREGSSVRYSLADPRVLIALDTMHSVLLDMLARDGALSQRLT